jgi:hypothetical protein
MASYNASKAEKHNMADNSGTFSLILASQYSTALQNINLCLSRFLSF